MSNQKILQYTNFKGTTDNHRWGNTIRKLFFNSNGVSLMVDESSSPIVFSLHDHDHDGHQGGENRTDL